MNVMPGMALFKLADLSVVWLMADIYEYELHSSDWGSRLPFIYPTCQGKVHREAIYIYPSLSPETRTAKVRFEFPNSQANSNLRCMPT